MLRIRFWAPASRPYHQEAWAHLGTRIEPLLALAPPLRRAVDAGARWFQALGQQQHAQ